MVDERLGVLHSLRWAGHRVDGDHLAGPAPELSLDPRAVTPPTLEQDSPVAAAVIYRDGRRVECLPTFAETHRRLREHPGAMAWIGLYRPDEAAVLAVGRGVRPARAGRRGRHRGAPAAEAGALRRHAVRGAARRALPRRRPRRSSSASCTSSSARTSCSPSGTARRRTCRRSAGGWRATPTCSRLGPEAVLYAILDASSTATRRWSPACRTTSTRSRPRCSAATRGCRGASTSCPAR